MKTHDKLPHESSSYWEASTPMTSYLPLEQNLKTEVTVIGGGITGIVTAYLLVQEGVQVVMLEADSLFTGATGYTTAKVTAQHDLIYAEFIAHFGIEKTRQYYDANQEAIQFIRSLIEANQILCEFTAQDAFIYTNEIDGISKLEQEWEAYQRLGFTDSEAGMTETMPLNSIPMRAALVMKDQAQFHPLHYLSFMVQEIIRCGGQIYEQTTATDIEEGTEPRVITSKGHQVTSQYIVCASHFPFYDKRGMYYARLYAERSYVLAAFTATPYPGGMYLSADQSKRSLRSATINGQKAVLIGGEGHKTGQSEDTLKHYKALHTFGESVFGEFTSIPYRWSTQDLTTLDKLPYIGSITDRRHNILVATGFRKWGMTNSHVAGFIIRDHILDRKNHYAELYRPSRFAPDPSIKHFFSQNRDVATQFIEGKLDRSELIPEDLKPNEGAVVTIKGQRAGAYKDDSGTIYLVDTTCTHMGCEVNWNNAETTWDCPCHGSRFSYDGKVKEGPANQALKTLNYEPVQPVNN